MNIRSLHRSAILALCLLSSCAAAGPSQRDQAAADAGAAADPSSPAAGEYLVGHFAGQQGDLQLAARSFLDALAQDPSIAELQDQAFLACLLTGRPETERLARALPDNPVAQLYLADRAAQRGAWDDAQNRFSALPQQPLTQSLQPLLIAWTQMGAGHPDMALATLRPYFEGRTSRAIYALHAAFIADLSQRDPEAARLYHQAETTPNAMDLGLTRAVASWQARRGDIAAARHTLEAFAAQNPDLAIALPGLERDVANRQVRGPTDGLADAYFALASALRDQDATEFAALVLRLSLDLRPDLTGARLLSADILTDTKHPENALWVLEPVSADDPLAAIVDLRRASLLDTLGRSSEALAVLGRMEQRYPDRPEPWSLQGSILRSQHRFAEAVTAFDEAVKRVPTPARANWPLFYERGIALDRANRWPQAQADFQHALELSPDQPDVLNYLAYSWTEQGRNLPQARQMLDRAVAQRPNDGAIIDSLGWLQLRQGDVAGAVRDLEHAVELEPEDPTINGHLGDAYYAAGRHREAMYQWRLALTFNPDPDDKARLKARLREAGVTDEPATSSAAAKATQ